MCDAYTYRDVLSGKTRRTRGQFERWDGPTGLLKAYYAIFRTPKTVVCVPEYCLTPESRERLPKSPRRRIATLRQLVATYEAERATRAVPGDGSDWRRALRGDKLWLARFPARYDTDALRRVLAARDAAFWTQKGSSR